MSFIAGVISLRHPLGDNDRSGFLKALEYQKGLLPWPIESIQSDSALLAAAGFAHMWQGPIAVSTPEQDAVAVGVQWRRLPHPQQSLPFITRALSSGSYPPEDSFDYFCCAVFDKIARKAILAADTTGMAPIFYTILDGLLVFSTRQTILKRYLGQNFRMDRQGALEYLIIGHNLGDKTLLKGVCVLPPGSRLVAGEEGCRIIGADGSGALGKKPETVKEAAAAIWDHLASKVKGYAGLANRPFAGLLSGGWDSRLLLGLFAREDLLSMGFTSQQRILFQSRIISEKKIAEEVAQCLGIPNRFVAPIYRDHKNRSFRAGVLDYTTWFHDWAFSLADKLPLDKYIFMDGLLGDILLRGLYIIDGLSRAVLEADREKAVQLLHSRYMEGFNPYTRSISDWAAIIRKQYLDGFKHRLMEEVRSELFHLQAEDFVTPFLLGNRSRRGISPLPRYIFGRRGEIIFPLCDRVFVGKCLNIPLRMRRDPALYTMLLEKCRRGLSDIVSTNIDDRARLSDYLVDSIREVSGSKMPGDYSIEAKKLEWAGDFCAHPPERMEEMLRPELAAAIRIKDTDLLIRNRFFLERVMILESFYRL